MMKIRLLELVSGAAAARGTAVVIDVFRASTTACHAFAAGAAAVWPVASVEEALALKAENPDLVLVGERGCLMPEGFDFGNSPTELDAADLAGKTVVHATSAGTRGLVAAMGAAETVLMGGFCNMAATVAALAGHEEVSLVAMGKAGEAPAPEDKLCAMYLANCLQDVPNAFAAIPRFLRGTDSASIFFGDTAIVPESDFTHCLTLDAFDFFLQAERLPGGRIVLNRRLPAPSAGSATPPGEA